MIFLTILSVFCIKKRIHNIIKYNAYYNLTKMVSVVNKDLYNNKIDSYYRG